MSQVKFEHFINKLIPKFGSNGLLYSTETNIDMNGRYDDEMRSKHTFKMHDISIIIIDLNYYRKMVNVKEIVDILNKIRGLKRCELNVTSLTLRKKLHIIKL